MIDLETTEVTQPRTLHNSSRVGVSQSAIMFGYSNHPQKGTFEDYYNHHGHNNTNNTNNTNSKGMPHPPHHPHHMEPSADYPNSGASSSMEPYGDWYTPRPNHHSHVSELQSYLSQRGGGPSGCEAVVSPEEPTSCSSSTMPYHASPTSSSPYRRGGGGGPSSSPASFVGQPSPSPVQYYGSTTTTSSYREGPAPSCYYSSESNSPTPVPSSQPYINNNDPTMMTPTRRYGPPAPSPSPYDGATGTMMGSSYNTNNNTNNNNHNYPLPAHAYGRHHHHPRHPHPSSYYSSSSCEEMTTAIPSPMHRSQQQQQQPQHRNYYSSYHQQPRNLPHPIPQYHPQHYEMTSTASSMPSSQYHHQAHPLQQRTPPPPTSPSSYQHQHQHQHHEYSCYTSSSSTISSYDPQAYPGGGGMYDPAYEQTSSDGILPRLSSSTSTQGRVHEVGDNDVLCGRGAPTNWNPGNQVFRDLVKKYQAEYLASRRADKPLIAYKIVEEIKSRGGRFLKRHKVAGAWERGHFEWVDIGEQRAYEKACQALREGAPHIRRLILATSSSPHSKKGTEGEGTATASTCEEESTTGLASEDGESLLRETTTIKQEQQQEEEEKQPSSSLSSSQERKQEESIETSKAESL